MVHTFIDKELYVKQFDFVSFFWGLHFTKRLDGPEQEEERSSLRRPRHHLYASLPALRAHLVATASHSSPALRLRPDDVCRMVYGGEGFEDVPGWGVVAVVLGGYG